LEAAGITHVVLNLTSNWLTEFDVAVEIAKDQFESLFRELTEIFNEQGIKKAIVLTSPIDKSQERPANSLHLVVMQALIDISKQGNQLFDFIDYQRTLESKGLNHGNDGFRAILKDIGKNYFNA